MVHSPKIQSKQHVDVPPRGFIPSFKLWVGRFISNFAHLSFNLYELIRKTEQAAQPAISKTDTDKNKQSSLSDKDFEKIPKDKSKVDQIPSPNLDKTKKDSSISSEKNEKKPPFILSEQIETKPSSQIETKLSQTDIILDEEAGESIVSSLFRNMGLKVNVEEALTKGTIFDLKGKKQTDIKPEQMNGTFQVEWNLVSSSKDEPIKLIYKGDFQKGIFHGQGTFQTQDHDQSLHLLLEGRFEHGAFAAGLLVIRDHKSSTPKHYMIDGTFINGQLRGTGTIHYLEDGAEQLQYRGDFLDVDAHGKGKVLSLSPVTGIQIIGEGEFEKGMPIRGRFYREDNILEGEFNKAKGYFKGKKINLDDESEYEGELDLKKWEANGQGQWVTMESCTHKELVKVKGSTDEFLVDTIDDKFQRTRIGEFKNDELYKGEETIVWSDKKRGVSRIENGETISTVITIPSGLDYFGRKYEGSFTLGSLDGRGSIYSSDGKEIYQGQIKGGYPHGKGRLIENDGFVEGNFKWGDLIEDKDKKDTQSTK